MYCAAAKNNNLPALCYSAAMSSIAGLMGMRHIALKVRDMARAKKFYREHRTCANVFKWDGVAWCWMCGALDAEPPVMVTPYDLSQPR